MTEGRGSRDIVSRPRRRESASNTDTTGRLLAVVVGIDRYEHVAINNLKCAVNDAESVANAIRQTQPEEILELKLLTDPAREPGAGNPTHARILGAVKEIAETAGPEDTVMIYLAGHGGIFHEQPCVFLSDFRLSHDGGQVNLEGTIQVDELQDLFQESSCQRRVMFLDCCQTALSDDPADTTSFAETNELTRALPWRTGLPLASELLDAFQKSATLWSLVIACGPNELSLEDPQWGGHGIFSHFLAAGLRGEADLDGDQIVSLPELVQYMAARIPLQAEAVIDELPDDEKAGLMQVSQTPTIVWSGPIAFPLTRCVDQRRVSWSLDVLGLWWRFLRQRLPYPLAVEPMARYGTAFLYGLTMALTAWLFLRNLPAGTWAVSGTVGIVSGLLWLTNFALAGAANETRWHAGGYVASSFTVAWHILVLVFLIALPDRVDPQRALELGAGLLAVLIIMIVFGHNVLHCMIALADMVKRNERVAGRRAFQQLKNHWIHADINNMIAMVSAHPNLYQVLGLVVSVLAISHAGYALATISISDGAALHVARDFVLLVLVEWQVQWFAASFRKLRSILAPEG